MKNWKWFFIAVGAVLVIVGVWFLMQRQGWWGSQVGENGLPVIEISLNGVSLDEIDQNSKEIKYEGNGLRLTADGETQDYEGVRVKGRGNGTWMQDKKPYQIKFARKTDLLGLGKVRKWYLLANYMDVTNLRTEAAFYLEEMLGMEYRFEGRFVELYVDGNYRGLYYLTHAVEISKNTVDLKNPLGILVELDNLYGQGEENYESGAGETLVVKDVVMEDMKEAAMTDFMRSFDALEVAVEEQDFARVEELIDVRSWAQYYLLSEFTVNPDAYWTSFYFYKDGAEDKIHAGPGWDFDLAWGNRAWGTWLGEAFYSPTETMVRRQEVLPREVYEEMGLDEQYELSSMLSPLMYKMMEMPEFREAVAELYRERLAGREVELVRHIRLWAQKIKPAAKADETKWWDNWVMQRDDVGEFELEVDRMVEWILARYRYFETVYLTET